MRSETACNNIGRLLKRLSQEVVLRNTHKTLLCVWKHPVIDKNDINIDNFMSIDPQVSANHLGVDSNFIPPHSAVSANNLWEHNISKATVVMYLNDTRIYSLECHWNFVLQTSQVVYCKTDSTFRLKTRQKPGLTLCNHERKYLHAFSWKRQPVSQDYVFLFILCHHFLVILHRDFPDVEFSSLERGQSFQWFWGCHSS